MQRLVLDTNPRILLLIVCCPRPLWWCLTALKTQSEEEKFNETCGQILAWRAQGLVHIEPKLWILFYARQQIRNLTHRTLAAEISGGFLADCGQYYILRRRW